MPGSSKNAPPVAIRWTERQQCVWVVWLVAVATIVLPAQSLLSRHECRRQSGTRRPSLHLSSSGSDEAAPLATNTKAAFDDAVLNRYACKKFKRFDGKDDDDDLPSTSDPSVVQQALHSLELARLAPSAFNTQPYRVVLVHSKEQKVALSKYCLGPNSKRVLDSDCTAVFLADREVFRTLPRFRAFLQETADPHRKPSRKALLIMQIYITLFSSGYPLPRLLAAPISFCVRTVVSFIHLLTKRLYPLPSLANAETWASKQVALVAMTYMLGCSSKGLATIPMEGFNASGIRKVLKIPRRFAIPMIVGTGLAFKDNKDARLAKTTSRRYPMEEVIFGDSFGDQIRLSPQS